VSWVEVFAVFVVSHLVGDFLIQTEWQASHKLGGLGGVAGGAGRAAGALPRRRGAGSNRRPTCERRSKPRITMS